MCVQKVFFVLKRQLHLSFSMQIFLSNQHLYTVEQNDAEELVARAARNIEQLLRKRSAALEVKFTPLKGTNCQFAVCL